jgi:hypothetical protein
MDKQEEVIEETSFVKEGESLDLTLEENLMLEEPFEEPERKGDKKLPPPELKPLPYRFLDDIISSKLTGEEEELMAVLKKFHKAFGYSMDDLKGISPSIATHRIFMEEEAQSIAEFSQRMKLEMKEVVRKRNNLLIGCKYNISCEGK